MMLKTNKKQLWVPLLIALALSLITIFSQPLGKIDRVWSDIMLTSKKTPISSNYLIVDITAQDMAQFDGPPIPRNVLANVLTRLQDANVNRVMLDLTFSEERSSKKDFPLIIAMAEFGPERLALSQGSAPKFNAHATQVNLGLLTDPDGWTRAVRTSKNAHGYNPATWLATGQLSKAQVNVDLRYDPASIERISLADVLEGHHRDLAGYNVIISPSSLLASSRVQLPLSSSPDRSNLIILASESASAGYQNTAVKSRLVALTFALLFTLCGVSFAAFIQKKRILFLTMLFMCFMTIGLNMVMMKLWGGQGYPVLQFTCLLIGLCVTTAYRLRLFQMIASFLKGDLSPEEAWAWRAHEDSQFPVILINAMGNIRRMNPAAMQMKSWLAHDFEQKCQVDFRVGSKDVSLRDQEGARRKFNLERPNNSVAIIIMKDVTEAARKFDELKANSEHLEKTTRDLLKSQNQAIQRAENYQQEKIRAEQVSQLKTNFLANMSHELRTPLNAIIGFSEIMQLEMFGPVGDQRYKEFTNKIMSSGQHLLSLINDILDLSKIEAGKMELNFEHTQVNDLVDQVISMLDIRAQNAGLKLIYESATLPEINADPRAIKQILLNLMTNAIKFTPENGHITVTAEAQPSGLLIHVADSGVGISQDDIKRLAQPFEQVENKSSKKVEGTGLGLSLSKSLVELHGGTFQMESTLGKGTTISFTLPNNELAEQKDIVALAHPISDPVLSSSISSQHLMQAK